MFPPTKSRPFINSSRCSAFMNISGFSLTIFFNSSICSILYNSIKNASFNSWVNSSSSILPFTTWRRATSPRNKSSMAAARPSRSSCPSSKNCGITLPLSSKKLYFFNASNVSGDNSTLFKMPIISSQRESNFGTSSA